MLDWLLVFYVVCGAKPPTMFGYGFTLGKGLGFSISSCLSIIRDIFIIVCFSLLVWSYPNETFCVFYMFIQKNFIHICGNLIFLAIWYELPNDIENSGKSNSVKSLMVIEVEDYQARCLLYPSIATSQY